MLALLLAGLGMNVSAARWKYAKRIGSAGTCLGGIALAIAMFVEQA